MDYIRQLEAMRDAAVKMRDEAKERLEARLREIQHGPDARLIAGLGPVIEGYEKVLRHTDAGPAANASMDHSSGNDLSDDGALQAVEGAELEPLGEDLSASDDLSADSGFSSDAAANEDDEMSLEDSLEAELLGDMGKS